MINPEITILFSTKGRTLQCLQPMVSSAMILDVLLINANDFINNPKDTIETIQSNIKSKELIIRSSSDQEDCINSSNAGHFNTIPSVEKDNDQVLANAIESVIDSYGEHSDNSEILIQEMVQDIKLSGVLITADLDTLSPYYIINYSISKDTDVITSGRTGEIETHIIFKDAKHEPKQAFLKSIIKLGKELEGIFEHSFLDIEFAIDNSDRLYLFQVRPLVQANKENLSTVNLSRSLLKIHNKILKLSQPHPNLLGKKSLFGIMPDWNPAEIIGIRPRRLALSLYKELVTDEVWALQRSHYGYRNLVSHPLLVSFLGVPFIDVRLDFNSFIPKDLNPNIAEKLVNFYLEELEKKPFLHDKIEFKIVHSCYYLNLPTKLEQLLEHGFNVDELKRIEFSLLTLTNKVIDPENGHFKNDIEQINLLQGKTESILRSELSIVDKIYWSAKYCKKFGTLPFAGIARAAFIAVQLLQSIQEIGIITQNEYNDFLNSLTTVSSNLSNDRYRLQQKEITKEAFLEEYGHLRPGTYDILSARYDENFSEYFDNTDMSNPKENVVPFSFSKKQLHKLDEVLLENGIQINADALIIFITNSIESREQAKFIFTKTLSKVLQLTEEIGNKFNFTRDDMSHLDIQIILEMSSSVDNRDVPEIFNTNIDRNRTLYEHTKSVKFPHLITSAGDIYQYQLSSDEPNYVTLKKVQADIVLEGFLQEKDLEDKIIFISSADPGYDYLFTKKIAGLITLYGGANSHMAIRCAELGIPAVIGAGETNFNKWQKMKTIIIDPINKTVTKFHI